MSAERVARSLPSRGRPVVLSAEELDDTRLLGIDLTVLAGIRHLTNQGKEVSTRTLTEWGGLPERSVDDSLSRLIDTGYAVEVP